MFKRAGVLRESGNFRWGASLRMSNASFLHVILKFGILKRRFDLLSLTTPLLWLNTNIKKRNEIRCTLLTLGSILGLLHFYIFFEINFHFIFGIVEPAQPLPPYCAAAVRNSKNWIVRKKKKIPIPSMIYAMVVIFHVTRLSRWRWWIVLLHTSIITRANTYSR